MAKTPASMRCSELVKATPNRTIALELVDDDDRPLGHYTTRFVDGQFGLNLRRSFLRLVVEDSDGFIEHPERLDWSWIGRAEGTCPGGFLQWRQ